MLKSSKVFPALDIFLSLILYLFISSLQILYCQSCFCFKTIIQDLFKISGNSFQFQYHQQCCDQYSQGHICPMGNTRRNCEPQWSLICLWPSLATSMNFNIPPHYPQANGKAERDPRRQEDIEAVTSLSCTFVVPSKTSNIHRHEPLPFDNGKINPHPSTYIGIQLEAGSTEPRSCYQKGRAIQNCIPSALWQENWTATPSRPKARWLSSCKVRSAERVPGKVIARSPTPPSYVIQKPFRVVRKNRRHLRLAISLDRVEMPDEQDLNLEPISQTKDPSSVTNTNSGKPLQIMEPCEVTSTVPFSTNTQPSFPQLRVRTSSDRVARDLVWFEVLEC